MDKNIAKCSCGIKIEIAINPIHPVKITCLVCNNRIFVQKDINEIDLAGIDVDANTVIGADSNLAEAKTIKDLENNSHSPNIIGDYQIVEKIGEGGMGIVFLVKKLGSKEKFVIKLLKTAVLDAEKRNKLVQYFIREAQILKDLNHPNVLKFENCGNHNGNPFLVTEYIAGSDLKNILQKSGPMKLSKAITITYYLTKALEYGHKQKLIHRDIKPSNIIIQTSNKDMPKLVDFGLAKSLGPYHSSLTQEGAILGTPFFMPVEQVKSSKDVDHRADIYSLGATLFYMLAGKPPFFEYRGSHQEILSAILNNKITPLSHYKKLPQKIYDIVNKSMAFKAEDRYSCATEFKKDIENFFSSIR